MRALITGSEGFIGGHLTELLKNLDYDVWASVEDKNKQAPLLADHTLICDVCDTAQVNGAIAMANPDVIYHLAAQSYPTVSWEFPQKTLETNAIGTANIFEAVLAHDIDPIIIVACSSAEYGFVKEDEVPVTEDHPLKPLHPYGVSKVAQDLLTYQYHENNGLKGISARIFNTTGPGKVKDVVSDFAKRVAECEKGLRESIAHGNLQTKRDITDVRDMARGLNACEKVRPGNAYNLCSSRAHLIADILKDLISMANSDISSFEDPLLMRPTDEPIIMGDNSKIKKETNWEPKIPLKKTLGDTLDFFRKRL